MIKNLNETAIIPPVKPCLNFGGTGLNSENFRSYRKSFPYTKTTLNLWSTALKLLNI